MPKEAIDGLEQQTHRRVLKTHLPVDALVFSPQAKYLYIGRDGRDVVWSLFNHHINATDAFFDAFNDTPGRVGPRLERGQPTCTPSTPDWLDRERRALLAVLGERPLLVGDPPSAERAARCISAT